MKLFRIHTISSAIVMAQVVIFSFPSRSGSVRNLLARAFTTTSTRTALTTAAARRHFVVGRSIRPLTSSSTLDSGIINTSTRSKSTELSVAVDSDLDAALDDVLEDVFAEVNGEPTIQRDMPARSVVSVRERERRLSLPNANENRNPQLTSPRALFFLVCF